MTIEQASKIVDNYTDDKIIDSHQILNRGEVNQTYVFETETNKYVLRVDLDEDNLDRFNKEAWCMQVARELGVLSTEFLKIGLDKGHPYMIMPFVNGVDGDESTEKELIWKTLGEYARKIHSIPTQGYGENMTEPGVFSGSWSEYLDYNISSLKSDDKAIELGVITNEQSAKLKQIFIDLNNTDFKFGLSHHDLAPKNSIVTPENKVCLIDWGSANVTVVPHMDIAEILASSLGETSHNFALFLEGYGMSYAEYDKIRTQMSHLELLTCMDKLRWAVDRKKERFDHFSQEVKNKLAKL